MYTQTGTFAVFKTNLTLHTRFRVLRLVRRPMTVCRALAIFADVTWRVPPVPVDVWNRQDTRMTGHRLPGIGISAYVSFLYAYPTGQTHVRRWKGFSFNPAEFLFPPSRLRSTRANRPVARAYTNPPGWLTTTETYYERKTRGTKVVLSSVSAVSLSPGENLVCACNKCFYSPKPWQCSSRRPTFGQNVLFPIRPAGFPLYAYPPCSGHFPISTFVNAPLTVYAEKVPRRVIQFKTSLLNRHKHATVRNRNCCVSIKIAPCFDQYDDTRPAWAARLRILVGRNV